MSLEPFFKAFSGFLRRNDFPFFYLLHAFFDDIKDEQTFHQFINGELVRKIFYHIKNLLFCHGDFFCERGKVIP